MKKIKKLLLALAIAFTTSFGAHAQYYQLVDQTTDILSMILRGGSSYRGYLDATYLNGIGNKSANFYEISTTHGCKYGNIFFMGIGLGVDYMKTKVNDGYYAPENNTGKTSAVAIPLYTDFRLNFGSQQASNFFIDLKIGASFYVSDRYILVGDGYINSRESFLLRPTIGMRVPISKSNPKLACNIGASYQLLTNSYWYNPNGSNSCTLNSVGVNIGLEW